MTDSQLLQLCLRMACYGYFKGRKTNSRGAKAFGKWLETNIPDILDEVKRALIECREECGEVETCSN